MGDEYRNIAGPGANVGAMISKVDGTVNLGAGIHNAVDRPVLDYLSATIDELRAELRATRQRGEIDEDSAVAVEKELDEAALNLPLADGAAGSRFVVAMKRAKGLVEGLAGLTTKVAEAIAAVQGMQ